MDPNARIRRAGPGPGAPAVLAVTGEAGAGKSTLWRAAVEVAARAGCRVLRSEPSAGEADSSFVGLSDLLADVLPAVKAGIPGPQREALEVALLLKPAGDQPPSAHAVGLAVLTVLRSCLQEGPVLIAVDDVQWLDAGSLGALTFALRRVADEPLTVLLAARTEAPADPLTLGAPPVPHGWRDLLAAVPAAEQLTLAPLDARQVRDLLPPEASAAQARLVAGQSRGNPFWAREVWASLDTAGGTVPPLARALTDRLCRSLTPGAAEALAVVAAAGRLAMPDALAVLGHLEDPAAALDEAVLAGLVAETAGRLAAAHPLIAAAAVESVPPGRGRALPAAGRGLRATRAVRPLRRAGGRAGPRPRRGRRAGRGRRGGPRAGRQRRGRPVRRPGRGVHPGGAGRGAGPPPHPGRRAPAHGRRPRRVAQPPDRPGHRRAGHRRTSSARSRC